MGFSRFRSDTVSVQWDDANVLQVLHLIEREGMSAADVGKRFGCSRSAILGLLKRVRDDLAKVPDLARKRENRDGGMPAGWHLAGLQKRVRA